MNLPALSLDSIHLIQNQSNVGFTVGLPIPTLASFFGTIKATATMLSDNATGAHFDGLDAEIGASQKPEISGVTVTAPFKAFFGHLQFQLSTNTWNVSLTFDVPGAGGISASTQIVQGAPTAVHFSASYLTPGLAIGDTGAFLQGIDGGFTNYPHYSRPKIGLTRSSGNGATDAARSSECANINQYYDQYIALNQAFPSYCGQVGLISFDPPLEVDGNVRISAGPVIASKSALIISGGFRYVDSYFDGSNSVPWAFNVQGGVTMLGLPFNRTTQQVYPNSSGVSKSSFVPVNNAGKQAWATIHGDGLVEAGGGFDYAFPQNTNNWFIKVTGDVGLSLIPKGAAIGAPPAGATPAQYANVVQSHANSWAAVGTISGSICAQIPTVVSACATGAAGISNIGVAGCASFAVPGSQVLQSIARAGAAAINAIAAFGQQAGVQIAQTGRRSRQPGGRGRGGERDRHPEHRHQCGKRGDAGRQRGRKWSTERGQHRRQLVLPRSAGDRSGGDRSGPADRSGGDRSGPAGGCATTPRSRRGRRQRQHHDSRCQFRNRSALSLGRRLDRSAQQLQPRRPAVGAERA